MDIKEWKAKDPNECFAVAFDFSARLTNVTGAKISVECVKGVDANPELMLYGNPQFTGGVVRQRIIGGIDKNKYKFKCLATDGVESHAAASLLPIVSLGKIGASAAASIVEGNDTVVVSATVV